MTGLRYDAPLRGRAREASTYSPSRSVAVTRTFGRGRLVVIGLLLGTSAGATGVTVGPLRLWYLTTAVAFILALAPEPGRVIRLRPRALDLVAVGYLVVTGLAELTNSKALGYPADYSDLIAILGYLVGYLACRIAVTDSRSMSTLLIGFVAPGVPSAVLGIGQAVAPSMFRFVTALAPSSALADRYDDASLIRATGLVGIWTGFGYYLTCVAVGCAIILATRSRSRRRTAYAWVVLAVSLAGIGSSLTFGTIGVAAIVLLVVLVQSKRPVLAGTLAAVVCAIGAALFGSQFAGRISDQTVVGASLDWLPSWVPNTISYRAYIWVNQTVPAIASRPVTGWGSSVYGGDDAGRLYPSQLQWPSAESQYFATAISYGVLAAVLFALLYLIATVSVLRVQRWSRSNPAAAMVVLSMTALVAGTTFAIVSNRGFPGAYWPLLGAVLAGLAPRRWAAVPDAEVLDAPALEHRSDSKGKRKPCKKNRSETARAAEGVSR